MTQGYRASVHIDFFPIESEIFFYGEILRRKSFVDFEVVDLVLSETRAFETFANRWHRTNSHDRRIDTGNGPSAKCGLRSPTLFFRAFGCGQNQSRCSIDNSARIARRDRAFFSKGSAQLGQLFHRSIRLDVIVRFHFELLAALFHLQWNDFFSKQSFLHRFRAKLVAAIGEFILSFARDAEFLRQVLRSLRHIKTAIRILQRCEKQILHHRLSPKTHSLSQTPNRERRLAHIFHSARNSHFGFAELHQLRCGNQRLNS